MFFPGSFFSACSRSPICALPSAKALFNSSAQADYGKNKGRAQNLLVAEKIMPHISGYDGSGGNGKSISPFFVYEGYKGNGKKTCIAEETEDTQGKEGVEPFIVGIGKHLVSPYGTHLSGTEFIGIVCVAVRPHAKKLIGKRQLCKHFHGDAPGKASSVAPVIIKDKVIALKKRNIDPIGRKYQDRRQKYHGYHCQHQNSGTDDPDPSDNNIMCHLKYGICDI